MPGLYDWYLVRYQGALLAQGVVYGHPTLSDGMFIHTSPIREIEEEEVGLVLMTHSGNRYVLRPEEVDPGREEDILSSLEALGIGTGFVENYLRARREADARIQEEEERLVGPGELLLAVVGNNVIRALFRDSGGTPVSVKPRVHVGMFVDSVLITDWDGGRVDFRYFPKDDRMEPYHVSDGLRRIRVRNLGTRAIYFGKAGRGTLCPPGEITVVPAAEHDDEGLFSSDAVNGKCFLNGTGPDDGGKQCGKCPSNDGSRPPRRGLPRL